VLQITLWQDGGLLHETCDTQTASGKAKHKIRLAKILHSWAVSSIERLKRKGWHGNAWYSFTS
jgi:HD superfamily phosphodiesterase